MFIQYFKYLKWGQVGGEKGVEQVEGNSIPYENKK
jgi:hypothetical protein